MNWVSISRIAKFVALAAFFLPWMAVSCQNQQIATLSGIELATGFLSPETMEKLPDRSLGAGQVQWLVLLAAAAGIAGLIIGWRRLTRDPARNAMIASWIAAGSVFLSPFVLEWTIEGALMGEGSGSDVMAVVTVDRQLGFWLALIGFVTAAIAWRQFRQGAAFPGLLPSTKPSATSPAVEEAARISAADVTGTPSTLDRMSGAWPDDDQFATPRKPGEPGPVQSEGWGGLRPGGLVLKNVPADAVAPVLLFAAALALLESVGWILNAQILDLYSARTGWSPELGFDPQKEAWRHALLWCSAPACIAGILLAAALHKRLRILALLVPGVLAGVGMLLLPKLPGVLPLFFSPLCLEASIAIVWCLALYAVAERRELPESILWFGALAAISRGFSFLLDGWLRDGWDPLTESSTQGAVSLLGIQVVYLILSIALAAILVSIVAIWKPSASSATPAGSKPTEAGDPGRSALAMLLRDPASLHMAIGFLLLGLLLPALWPQVWSAIFSNRGMLSDSEFAAQPIMAWTRLAPAIGALAGAVTVYMLARQTAAWRGLGPALALVCAPIGILASLTSPNSGLSAVLPLVCAYFPLAAVYAHLTSAAGERRAFSAAALCTFLLMAPSALAQEVNEVIAFAIRSVGETGADTGSIAPFGALMGTSLALLWPATHFLIAAQAMSRPLRDSRAPIITFVALGVMVFATCGYLVWRHVPGAQTALQQLVGMAAPAKAPQGSQPNPDVASVEVELVTPPPPAMTDTPAEPGIIITHKLPLDAITIKSGESLGRFRVDVDCRLMFDDIELSRLISRYTGQGGDRDVCEYGTLVSTSPSEQWAVTFGTLNDYGYDYIGIVSQRDARVVRKPAIFSDPEGEFVPGSRRSERYPHQGLRPLQIWSPDERFLLLAEGIWNGIPCALSMDDAAIACPRKPDVERAVLGALRSAGASCPADSGACGPRWDPGLGEMMFGDINSTSMNIPEPQWLSDEGMFAFKALGGFVADREDEYTQPVIGYEITIRVKPDGTLVSVSAAGPVFSGVAPSADPAPAEPQAPLAPDP